MTPVLIFLAVDFADFLNLESVMYRSLQRCFQVELLISNTLIVLSMNTLIVFMGYRALSSSQLLLMWINRNSGEIIRSHFIWDENSKKKKKKKTQRTSRSQQSQNSNTVVQVLVMHSFLHTTEHHRKHLGGGKWIWSVLDDQKYQQVGQEYYQPVLSGMTC